MIFTCTSCYAIWSSLALHATLYDLHLHFMLRYMIFTCTSCYAIWSSLALHATLYDLHLHFMLRYMIFTCTSCYAIWSSLALHECRAKHFFVNHSAGEFQRTERFRNRALSVHTGTIDSCWTQMKTYIPKSLSSQSKQIPLRIRSWQWRFTHAEHDNLFQLCGTQVAKL